MDQSMPKKGSTALAKTKDPKDTLVGWAYSLRSSPVVPQLPGPRFASTGAPSTNQTREASLQDIQAMLAALDEGDDEAVDIQDIAMDLARQNVTGTEEYFGILEEETEEIDDDSVGAEYE
jgi:hypothetical protein